MSLPKRFRGEASVSRTKKNRKRNKAKREQQRSALRRALRVESLEDRNLLATLTWEGDVDGNWATDNAGDTNWDTNMVPMDGDTLIFPGGAPNLVQTNDTIAGNSYTLNFTGAGYTIFGNDITLDNAGVDVSVANGVFNDVNVALTLVADSTLDIGVGGDLGVSNLTGAGGALNKDGDGLLSLFAGGAHDYTGSTNINAGVLNLQDFAELTGGGGLVTVAGGATLSGGANSQVNREVNGLAGSLIEARPGSNFFVGDLGSTSGFATEGDIFVAGGGILELLDDNEARLGDLTTVNGGLIANNGVSMSAGDVLEGTGTVFGDVDVNTGTISPGTSPGTLTINGDVTDFAGTFEVEIDGPNAVDVDLLDVVGGGTVELGGALLDLSGNYTPVFGDSFTILQSAMITGLGVFEDVNGDPINNGDTVFLNNAPLEITYAGGDVILTYDTTPVIVGTPGNDDIEVFRDGADLVVEVNSFERMRTNFNAVDSLSVDGLGGDDNLEVSYVGGPVVPTNGINYEGGPGGNDTLSIDGGNQLFNTVTHTFVNENDGNVDLDGDLITYTGLEPVIDNANAANRIFTFTGGAETITLGDDGVANNNFSRIDSTLGELVTFLNPTNSLTINAGTGNDDINVNALDGLYAASLIINGDGGTDNTQLNGVTLDTNNNGRGLEVNTSETLGITNSTIQNNTALIGGGILINGPGTTATISNTDVLDNTATGAAANQGGGGIFNNNAGGSLTINNGSTIDGNTATVGAGSGGGIFHAGGTLDINGSVISNNDANRAGGGIELGGAAGVTTLTATNLNNNDALGAPGNGGGLHVSGATNVTITGGTVNGNTAALEGGGLWNQAGALMTVNGTTINGNTSFGGVDATDGGGGIFNNGGDLLVQGGAQITNNVASSGVVGLSSGGGILSIGPGATVTVLNSTISGNDALRAGGGIEIGANAGLTTLTNVTLDNNDALGGGPGAPGNGGGLHITGAGNVNITGGTASGNNAALEGGGLWNGGGTMNISGTTINGNTASGAAADDGGGGIFNNGGTVNLLNGVQVTNNIADGAAGSGGGILNFGIGGILTVDGSAINISGNRANRAGGGIEHASLATLNLTNVTLNNNNTGVAPAVAAPGNGGGLHITGPADSNITGGTVNGNVAASEGGGLWNGAGTMTITNVQIDGNTASGNDADNGGGGVFNAGGTVIVNNANITNNIADGAAGSGGGILNDGGTLTVTGGSILSNRANRAGGGIEATAGTTNTLNFINLSNNNTGIAPAVAAPGNGGGLHITGNGNADINGGQATNNVAASEGGGLWNGTGTMNINGTLIDNNTASGNDATNGGGGVFNAGGTVNVNSGTSIINNDADGTLGSGGGIFNDGGTLTVTESLIGLNTAQRAGGGIEDNAGVLTTIVDSTIRMNNAGANPGNGGGIHISGAGTVNIDGTTIDNNQAQEGGGLWNSSTGTFNVTNSTISTNDAATSDGGGIFNTTGGTVDLDSVTITLNSSSGTGDGIAAGASGVTIENTIVAQNPGFGTEENLSGVSTSQDWNVIGDAAGPTLVGPQINTQFGADALLLPLAFYGGPNDTHLPAAGSPAIGNGMTALSVDQRDIVRPQGAQDDVGAVEADLDGFVISANTEFNNANTGDQAGDGNRDEFIIINDALGIVGNVQVFVNSQLVFSMPKATTGVIVIRGSADDDTVIVDNSNGLIGANIIFDGDGMFGNPTFPVAGGFDDLIVRGSTQTDTVYNPGGTVDAGAVFQTANQITQSIEFFGLEPVQIVGAGGTLTLGSAPLGVGFPQALNANNTINYTQGPNSNDPVDPVFAGALTGLISVDGFETLEFSNFATLNINSGPGDDHTNISNDVIPTGLTAINVDSGDPSASDVLEVDSQVGVADQLVVRPTAQGAGLVDYTANNLVDVNYANTETINLVGQLADGADQAGIDGTAGNDLFDVSIGATFDASTVVGLLNGGAFTLPTVNLSGFNPLAQPLLLNQFGAQGGTDAALLTTGELEETISYAAGVITATAAGLPVATVDVGSPGSATPGTTTLVGIQSSGGSDTINVTPEAGVTVRALGGQPDSGSDVLNFTGTGAGIVTLDLTTQTITEAGLGPVAYVDIETINIAANNALIVTGTAFNDTFNVTPGTVGAGSFDHNRSTGVGFNYTAATSTTFNGGGGIADTVNVQGDDAADVITSGASTVTVDGSTVTLGTGLEVLNVNGLDGNDSINLGALIFAGQTTISGGDGNDTLIGTPGNDIIFGGTGNDILIGGAGNDFQFGEEGADTFGNADVTTFGVADDPGMDFNFGGGGGDNFVWEPGDGPDVNDGGDSGADVFHFIGRGAGGDTFTLTPGVAPTTLIASFNGVPIANSGIEDVIVNPLGGNDTVNVNDLVATEVVNVNINAGGGNEIINVAGRSIADNLQVSSPGAGLVDVEGLSYNVRVNSAAIADTLTVNSGEGDDAVDVSNGVQNVITTTLNGGAGDDSLSGWFNTANGDAGDDTIIGAANNQTINGGAGEDVIDGRGGTNAISGGANIDTILVSGSAGPDTITTNHTPGPGGTFNITGGLSAGMNTLAANDFETVRIEGGGDDDNIIVNASTGAVGALDYVIDGGEGSDSVTMQGGPAVDEVIYGPGPDVKDGRLTYEDVANNTLFTMDFTNLEPLFDFIPAATLTVNATNADNAISYTQGSVAANGLVSVDGFETIEFSNKQNLVLNGRGGSDEFVLNNSTVPTALASVTVNGADPAISGDSVEIIGTTADDTFAYTATATNGGTVVQGGAIAMTYNLNGTESLAIDAIGQAAADALTVTTPNATITPGTDPGTGVVDPVSATGAPLLSLDYAGIESATVTGGTAVITGTSENDIITMSAAGIVTVTNELGFNNIVDVSAFNTVVINALGGDDTINIAGGATFAGGITVLGGDNGTSTDELNLIGAAATVENVAIAPSTIASQQAITGLGSAITSDGVELVTYVGANADDTLNVNLGEGDNTARVERGSDVAGVNADLVTSDSLPNIAFGGLNAFTVDGQAGNDEVTFATWFLAGATAANYSMAGGGTDALIIEGSNGAGGGNDSFTMTNPAVGSVAVTDGNGTGVTVTGTNATLGRVQVNGLGGDDTLTVNQSGGLITPDIMFDGGSGSDLLQVTGTTAVTNVIYTPGPDITEGRLTYDATMSIDFANLEPVQDNIVSANLTVNGTNAANAISYTNGPGGGIFAGPTGLVSVDGFETIEFNNKATLILNGNGGSDEFSTNAPIAPAQLTGITVNGGDPTAGSDVAIVSGTTGADAINFAPTTDDDAVITGAGPVPITLATVESAVIDGQGGVDALTYTSPAVRDNLIYTLGATPDAGEIDAATIGGALGALMPLAFTEISAIGSITFANAGGGRADNLELRGSSDNDVFNVSAVGGVVITDSFTFRHAAPIVTPGVGELLLHGLNGDDTFNIPGNHPFPGLSGRPGIIVEGGNPDSGSDVLNFTGSGTGAVTVDLGLQTITEAGFARVSYSGVETANVNAAGANLTVLGTTGNDTTVVTPTGPNAGTLVNNGASPTVNFTQTGTFTVDQLVGDDTLQVNYTTNGETIAVNVPAGIISDFTQEVVNFVNANTESVRVDGNEGNDTFNVLSDPNIPIFIDGGDPIGSTPGDTLTIIGPAIFEQGPENDEGSFTVPGNERVSFDHIEAAVVNAGPGVNNKAFIAGNGADNDITVIARDGSTHAGADGVRDFTVTIDAGLEVLWLNFDQLVVDAKGGDDDIVIQLPAPNNANWDVDAWIFGGPAAAGPGDEGDRLVIESPQSNGPDAILYTPTAVDSGFFVIDEDVNGAFSGTDTRIQIGNVPAMPPMPGFPNPDPGGIETLVYDGGTGNDAITVFGDQLGAGTNDIITHTPGSDPDGGTVLVNSLLALQYSDIGLTGALTIDGLAGTDTLNVVGTDQNDTFNVVAVTGTVQHTLSNGAVRVPINQANVEGLIIDSLAGDDTFNVPGNHPFAGVGGAGIVVNGGSPDSGSDVLNFTGSGAGAVTIDLGLQTTTEAGFAAVAYTGIETLNANAAGANLTVRGTTGNDTTVVTPTGPNAGTLVNNDAAPTVNFTNSATFTVDQLAGDDTLQVNFTTNADAITVNVPGGVINDAVNEAVNFVNANTESIRVDGGADGDTITVTPDPAIPVFIDGGDPIGSVGDTLVVTAGAAAVTTTPGPLGDQGAVDVAGNETISYDNIEAATVNTTGAVTAMGTGADDDITAVGSAANTVAVTVNDGATVTFVGTSNITLQGKHGDDDITVDINQANGVTFNVQGGLPTAGSDDLRITGVNGTNDMPVWTPNAADGGVMTFAGLMPINVTMIENLFYDGESDNETLQIAGSGSFLHTPGNSIDAGRFDLTSGGVTNLGINYENLGATGTVTAAGAGAANTLAALGTDASDTIAIVFTASNAIDVDLTSVHGVHVDVLSTNVQNYVVDSLEGDDNITINAPVNATGSFDLRGGGPSAGSDTLTINGAAGAGVTVTIIPDATLPDEQDITGLGARIDASGIEEIIYRGVGTVDTLVVDPASGDHNVRVDNGPGTFLDRVVSDSLPQIGFTGLLNFQVTSNNAESLSATFVLASLDGATNYQFIGDAQDTLIVEGLDGVNDTITATNPAGSNVSITDGNNTVTIPAADTAGRIRINPLGGNDNTIVNVGAADLVFIPISYDGGSGADVLNVNGSPATAIVNTVYTIGSDNSSGQLDYGTAATAADLTGTTLTGAMQIDFTNLQPVNDTAVATNLIVNANNEENDVTYQGGANATLGRVTVDGFERIDFNNKTNLILNSLNGGDTIVLNNAALPTGLTTVTANAGNGDDEIDVIALPNAAATAFVNATLNGNAGDDHIDGSDLTVTTPLIITGAQGADTLIGGRGNDTISGGAGDDLLSGGDPNITPNIGANTFNGGTGFDTILVQGTPGNDLLAVTQNQAIGGAGANYTLLTNINTITNTDNVTTVGGLAPANVGELPTVEEIRIEAGAGNDEIVVAHDDTYVNATGTGFAPVVTAAANDGVPQQMLRFDVRGDSPNASDRLTVQDLGLGDLVLHRQAVDQRTGRITVGPAVNTTTLPGFNGDVVYTGIENVDITPKNPLNGGTGTDFLGQVVTFDTDPFEYNDDILNTKDIGDFDIVVRSPNIDPFHNPALPVAVAAGNGDEDWYTFTPSQNGTFQINTLFRAIVNAQAATGGARPGLPGNGALAAAVYPAIGAATVPVVVGSPLLDPLGAVIGQQMQFAGLKGVTYYVRVTGAAVVGGGLAGVPGVGGAAAGTSASPAINEYELTIDQIDNLGPQVIDPDGPAFPAQAIQIVDSPFYNLFLNKPANAPTGPTPNVYGLTINFRDPISAAQTGVGPGATLGALDPATALNPGNYSLVGDANGIIPITNVAFAIPPLPTVAGTVQAPAAGAPNTLQTINAGGGLTTANGPIVGQTLQFTSGANVGQAKRITGYTPATGSMTFDTEFTAVPVPTDAYIITPAPAVVSPVHVLGTAVDTGGSSTTVINLGVGAATGAGLSAVAGAYVGQALQITSGPLNGEIRTITAYNGLGVFTVAGPYSAPPVATTTFNIVGTPSTIAGAVSAVLPLAANSFVSTTPPLSAVPNAYVGQALQFTSGVNVGQARVIKGYSIAVGGAVQFTFEQGFGAAPAANDTFVIAPATPVAVGNAVQAVSTPAIIRAGLGGVANAGLTGLAGDYVGRILQFTSGALTGQAQLITGYDNVAGAFFTANPFSAAPAVGDTFQILPVNTAAVTLSFAGQIPDDRYTLVVNDELKDFVGNQLDGESNASQPVGTPGFPSGDSSSGGDFVARFNVDSVAEIGVWGAGSVWVDTNQNYEFDPDTTDFANRDLTYSIGLTADDVFAGNFSPAGTRNAAAAGFAPASGYDKIAAYGSIFATNSNTNGFRWLVDVNDDGAIDPTTGDINVVDPAGLNGVPIAGNFDGNAANGDEVGFVTVVAGGGLQVRVDAAGATKDYLVDTTYTLAPHPADPLSLNVGGGYPIVGDFDGNGEDDIAVFRDDRFWVYLSTNAPGTPTSFAPNQAPNTNFRFGFITPRDRPVAADFNGDGIDDIGLWVPDRQGQTPREIAEWYILVSGTPSTTTGAAPTINPGTDGVSGSTSVLDRIIVDATLGDNYIPFNTTPFGQDIFAQFGDEFALPIVGNFDPPAEGEAVARDFNAPGGNLHTNLDDQYDTNMSGDVTLADVIVVINNINRNGGEGMLEGYAGEGEVRSDVNFNGRREILDAILVVNHINRNLAGELEGEGSAADSGQASPTFFVEQPSDSGNAQRYARSTDSQGSGSIVDDLIDEIIEARTEASTSPDIYTDLSEEDDLNLDDDLLADIASAIEDQ